MKDLDKYERAKKRVKELKGFYNHLKIFIVINGALYLIKSGWLTPWMPEGFPTESYYFDWINGNVIIWGLIVIIHGLILQRHKLPFLKNWEERQIKKFMEEDQEERERYK
ncbi:2TM domain-containing protein [Flagellimonas sp. S3867]|uniref:2TM domain-containing protein n=1 Tax=Flagellimonas sp. S3867 TaxID=2768063 RepID=UPI0016877A0C|nr:2TM domain-containing protein [Flagellimonas sp. S3867]